MSEFVCGVQTRGVRYVDPEPAEYCMTEVENEGDLCPRHEDDDRADDDYDRYLDDKAERDADPDYYTDYGD
jgi:hypothetical protein